MSMSQRESKDTPLSSRSRSIKIRARALYNLQQANNMLNCPLFARKVKTKRCSPILIFAFVWNYVLLIQYGTFYPKLPVNQLKRLRYIWLVFAGSAGSTWKFFLRSIFSKFAHLRSSFYDHTRPPYFTKVRRIHRELV
jgi:hypothetical protein